MKSSLSWVSEDDGVVDLALGDELYVDCKNIVLHVPGARLYVRSI